MSANQIKVPAKIAEEISGYIKSSTAIILVDYRGFSMEDDTQFRKAIRESGGMYKVYKKEHLQSLFHGAEFEPLAQHLNGCTGVVFCMENAMATVNVVLQTKENLPEIVIKGCVVNKAYCTAEKLMSLKEEDFLPMKTNAEETKTFPKFLGGLFGKKK